MMNSVNIIVIKLIVNFILPEMKNAKHGYSIFVYCNYCNGLYKSHWAFMKNKAHFL